MPIAEAVSLVSGAALGAPFSEILRLAIRQAKKVKDFKPLSEDLASTMERLVPVCKEIDSMQQGSITGQEELKFLYKTLKRAEEMALKGSRVKFYSIAKKASYTREIKRINKDFFKFCQIDLQVIHHRNQLQYMRLMEGVTMKIDQLSLTRKESPELFLVPQPKELTLSWLDQPLGALKKMVFEDGVVFVVVYAPSACGKTTLVTKLCHDADVKGKFKQILFVTVSKAPNIRLILQRLLEHTGCNANEFVNNFDARRCIQQLLMQVKQNGSILLVLDDVWPAEESLLENFLIQLPDFKILVTSRFEFRSFAPTTFHLEPSIDENVKNFFIECAPHPSCQSCAKYDHNLQKILKRCNGLPLAVSPPCSICEGCNSVIEHDGFVNVLGVLWHTECFACDACHKPIAIHEVVNHVSNSRGKFHKSCYKELMDPNCYVCKEKLPSTAESIKYNMHPFWMDKYCPSHDVDGTPKCSSCERLESWGTNYGVLFDGRLLCPECMESAVMDIVESHSLHFDMREFFEGLNMKVEQDFAFILVETQALNRAVEDDKIVSLEERPTRLIRKPDQRYEMLTRAICLSEQITIRKVLKATRTGTNNLLNDMTRESVLRECTVTAILIIYGLPRLLTGYMLAHEMMHAWLRINGYRNLNTVLEEGICQMLAHMWLESQKNSTTNATAAEASSSHTPPATAATSKKEEYSDFEKKLLEFCKFQIETDESIYGVGFRKVRDMMVSNNYNLKDALKEIVSTSSSG